MPSSWPGTVPSYTTKVNIVDVVDADHPNTLQDDVRAIALNLGVNPQTSTTVVPGDVFSATSVAYATVGARLTNIEKGVVGDSHSQYVKVAGGSTILSGVANAGLIVKALTGSSQNLIEFRTQSNTLVTYVDSSGVLRPGGGGSFASNQDLDNLKALVYMGSSI